ncbi:CCAAT/enhancer-binding protein gamma isoform X2 [Culicoides brevitarsis]|uniref:CCAAT/enhancer-binding protein gamma isoform X2 n=1 Tax=Culicoides brevitarsis TaxID=469753 RepID=UPI00307C27DF
MTCLAVKRSRVKSKQKTEETIARVDQLKSKNKKLEGKIEALNKQLAFLKSLFLEQAMAKKDNIDMEKLKEMLADIDSDDEDAEMEKA